MHPRIESHPPPDLCHDEEEEDHDGGDDDRYDDYLNKTLLRQHM